MTEVLYINSGPYFTGGLCLIHGGYKASPLFDGCPHCPRPRTVPFSVKDEALAALAEWERKYDHLPRRSSMPDLRTPEIRLADALDRIAELEAENDRLTALLAPEDEAERQSWRFLVSRNAHLETENLRLAELLAGREIGIEGLGDLVADAKPVVTIFDPPPQPSSAPQTAPGAQPVADAPSPHTCLWRALRAGKG